MLAIWEIIKPAPNNKRKERMPNTEEWCAIIALANKAYGVYKNKYDTANQYEIVMKWARKWNEEREKKRERARQWNKKHPERHNELNKESYKRKKGIKNGTHSKR